MNRIIYNSQQKVLGIFTDAELFIAKDEPKDVAALIILFFAGNYSQFQRNKLSDYITSSSFIHEVGLSKQRLNQLVKGYKDSKTQKFIEPKLTEFVDYIDGNPILLHRRLIDRFREKS